VKNGSGAERLRIFIVLILRGQSNRVIMLSWIRREAEDLPFLIPKVSRQGVAHHGVCRIRPAGLFLRLVGAGGGAYFGGGLLVSEKATAIEWHLTQREKDIINSLG
jgi:hypothetical protein